MLQHLAFFSLSLAATLANAANVSVPIGASDPNIGYSPFGAWGLIDAPGSFPGGANFLLSDANEGVVTYVFSSQSLSVSPSDLQMRVVADYTLE